MRHKAPTYNPTAIRSERAVQAWVILVSCAMNRQTITYGELGKRMFGRRAAGVLSQTLDRIHRYCDRKRLPALNSLVVNVGKGSPGRSIPMSLKLVDATRERVYGIEWFDVRVPTAADFDRRR